jgi:hypothetical protein
MTAHRADTADGLLPVSLSRYRTGMGLLADDDPAPPSPDPRKLFVTA